MPHIVEALLKLLKNLMNTKWGNSDMVTVGTVKDLALLVRSILFKPRQTFYVLAEDETLSISKMCRLYVARIAALPVISGFIGSQLYERELFGAFYKVPVMDAAKAAIYSYAFSFIAVSLLAWLISILAPRFQGKSSFRKAFILSSIAFTPLWLTGIIRILPDARIFTLFGLYGLLLLYIGIPILMESEKTKTLPFSIVAVLSNVLSLLLIGLLVTGRPVSDFTSQAHPASARPPSKLGQEPARNVFGLTREEVEANQQQYLQQEEERVEQERRWRCAAEESDPNDEFNLFKSPDCY